MMKFKYNIQIVDTDLTGRIHYSALFRYFERADNQFFKEIGYPYKTLLERGYDLPRAHVECDYLVPIGYDDELDVHVSIARIGKSSFTYRLEFYKGDQLAAKGVLINVFVDRSTGKAAPIPDDVRKAMEKHLLEKE